jgi:23S rRNA (adenine2503-C2)-methyltransferase
MPESKLLDLSYDAVRDRLIEIGEPAYRAKQIWQAAYRDLAASYDAMTTLPARLRTELAERLPFERPVAEATQRSQDGRTTKTLLRLADGEAIEVVAMRYDERRTVCVSTQVGCAMGCAICATGRGGFTRDLSTGEIVAQVLHVAAAVRANGRRLTHVVYMGMGEPLANYDAALGSIRILNDPHGFGLGARSFTVSTVGIVPGIERLTGENLQINLAVSLHAADDALRNRLLPINGTYPVDQLLAACRAYVEKTRRRITFEVALIDGVNDDVSHAERLAERMRGLRCHVNLIPFNPVPGCTWKRSPEDRVNRFARVLEGRGIPVTVRVRRGVEIQAGCGQLRTSRGG